MRLKNLIDRAGTSNTFIVISVLLVLISSATSLLLNISTLNNYYEETLGYKGKLLNDIKLLSAETNINYFEKILDRPVFINSLKNGRKEYIFVNKFFYTQAITDPEDRVLAYSITTRRKNFNPELTLGPYNDSGEVFVIKLGKTKFFEIDSFTDSPFDINSFLGAHDFFYSEGYYFGNPSSYQSFFFSLNESGYLNNVFPPSPKDKNLNLSLEDPDVKKFREEGIINTYTVTAPMIGLKELGYTHYNDLILGPNYYQVRVLQK